MYVGSIGYSIAYWTLQIY